MTLVANEVWTRFGAHEVLRAVDFRLEPGELVCLAGRNGAGKSTLLRTLCGLETCATGSVEYDGVPVGRSMSEIAFLPNPPPLYPYLTVDEHAELVAELWVTPLEPSADVWWAESGLDRLGDRVPEQLSLGQCQALSIGLLAMAHPLVWLLDEPFNGLDDDAAGRLCTRLGRAVADGAAVVVATHLFAALAPIATRLVWLESGAVLLDSELDGDLAAQVEGMSR